MRLDWIFLPRENPCAKFYIIIIIITTTIPPSGVEPRTINLYGYRLVYCDTTPTKYSTFTLTFKIKIMLTLTFFIMSLKFFTEDDFRLHGFSVVLFFVVRAEFQASV